MLLRRSVMHAQRSVKVWEGRQSVRITLKEFKNVSVSSNHTEREDMVVSQDDHAFYCYARRCCSLSHHSPSGLYGIEAAFTFCLLLRFRARLLALSSPLPSQLFPFWHRDNETASAATVLRTINLRKCTFCKQDVLIAFLNGTDVCAQATPLIAFLKCETTPLWPRTHTARLVSSC